jgi:hypothetical protein
MYLKEMGWKKRKVNEFVSGLRRSGRFEWKWSARRDGSRKMRENSWLDERLLGWVYTCNVTAYRKTVS